MNDPASKGDKADKQRAKTQQLLELRAAKKIQRHARGMRVRSAMRTIHILEDVVFVIPTPGEAAVAVLLAGPKPLEEEDTNADSSGLNSKAVSSAGSKNGTRPGSAEAESRGGDATECTSPASSSSSGSSSARSYSSTDSELIINLTEYTLIRQLRKWEVQEHRARAAQIFWLLNRSGEELLPEDLERVNQHHRIRRRNANSKVFLYLILMQHGDARQSLSTRPPTAGPLPNEGPRNLLPAGWNQVTRIAWALRLCPSWCPPGLMLTASSQCCLETAERLRSVLEEPNHLDLQGLGLRSQQENFEELAPMTKPCPAPTLCGPLDFPRSEALLGPTNHFVGEALAGLFRASEDKYHPKKKPKDPTPCHIIAGGVVIETLLACLTAGCPREALLTARLAGGDAVLLKSPPMCSISGEGKAERWRPSSDLWEEAILRRTDWTMVHHLRGDGRGQPLELGGIPNVKPPESAEFRTNLTAQWNRYAGAALILTDSQYLDIRKRAGMDQASGLGMGPQLCTTLRSLCKDYVMAPEPTVFEEEPPQELQRGVQRKATGQSKGMMRR